MGTPGAGSAMNDADDAFEARPTVVAGCPHLAGFDPVSKAAIDEPEPWMSVARRECPVFYIPEQDVWCVSRHEDVLEVLRDVETYSSLHAHRISVPMPPSIAAELGEDYVFPLTSQLSITDPPQHTRLRKGMQPNWTPRAIARWEPDVREITEGLIDDFAGDGRVDLVSRFAILVPSMVIAKMLGAPLEMGRPFHDWAPSLFQLEGNASLPEAESIAAWRDVIEWERYTRRLIREQAGSSADNLVTEMLQARNEDGEPAYDEQEILGNVIGFIGGGSDTSAILISHTLYFLLQRPELWERVKADPAGLLPKAIEETMRFRSSTTSVKRRTTCETVLNGVKIPAGADIWVNLHSANHDDEVFEDPDEFSLDRRDVKQHLGFGKWKHFCIGAPLVRLEVRVALESVIERMPEVRLAADQGPLDYSRNMVIPEIRELLVEW
jgi:cytochrome P450